MGPPVRTVCMTCLHSLELSTSADGLVGRVTCPYCGHEVQPSSFGSNTSTTGDGLDSPPDPDALTPRSYEEFPPLPMRIGRFVLREPLGEGGYGEVFRAYDPHLDREVALKVLKPNRLGEKALERFLREARAAARLDHPNIVGLHDAGRDEHRCWIAYQLVPGVTLSRFRDDNDPSIDEAVRIIRELALALDHAHSRGVYHRDLKPANVLIDKSGRARLTDFGLARRADLDSSLTQDGSILGTPQYMSPEAAAGRAHLADGRSDVYSLGIMLYELICGRRPADVPSGAPLWRSTKIATLPTPRSVDREIPPILDQITMRALAFHPDDRYPDAFSFGAALDDYLKGRPVPTFRRQASKTKPRKGGFAVGSIVAVSIVCLLLGMSFDVATRPTTFGRGLSASPRRVESVSLRPNNKTSRVDSMTPTVASPVGPFAVRSRQSHTFHLNGCRSTRTIAAENFVNFPYPSDEEIKAAKLKPCTYCEPTLEKATSLEARER